MNNFMVDGEYIIFDDVSYGNLGGENYVKEAFQRPKLMINQKQAVLWYKYYRKCFGRISLRV